jgi:hypothetical protein
MKRKYYAPGTTVRLWVFARNGYPTTATTDFGDCRFFVAIQGVREKRLGCVVDVRKYRTLSNRVPVVIHGIELIRSEGNDGPARILEKDNSGAQACEMWLLRQKK